MMEDGTILSTKIAPPKTGGAKDRGGEMPPVSSAAQPTYINSCGFASPDHSGFAFSETEYLFVDSIKSVYEKIN